METSPRYFNVPKRLSLEPKIIGLNYNTFFIFVVLACILILIGSQWKIIGFVVSIGVIGGLWLFLFFIQTKLGSRELRKRISTFFKEIPYIKVSSPFSRMMSQNRKMN